MTDAGDVHLVFTPGHTPGHVSVVVEEEDHVLFLAGDTSYSEELMLRGSVDGICQDVPAAASTLKRIAKLASERSTVYLPSHDPASLKRLAGRYVAAPAGPATSSPGRRHRRARRLSLEPSRWATPCDTGDRRERRDP